MDASPLAVLGTLDGYRQHFMDAALWRPFVARACQLSSLSCSSIRPALPGSFPTFIVDERHVVKFFGPLFDGKTCWQVEREAARRMEAVPEVPIARLLAAGGLAETPGWDFLIFDFIPGISIGEVYAQVSFEDRRDLVRRLGGWLKRMHRIEVHGETALPRLSPDLVHSWFAARWPADRQKWPDRLAGGVQAYLQKNAAFIQCSDGDFIHADLTQDHFLGTLAEGRWTTLGLIDFGDAMLGNLYYDLAALHLDLFDCDKRLLRAFLEAYGLPPDPDFVRKAMTTSLLHQFDVYGHLFAWKPALAEAASLDVLADRVWNIADTI